MKKNFFYGFLVFHLLFFLFVNSCKQSQKTVNQSVYNCKLISSSSSTDSFLYDQNNIWQSCSPAEGDFFIFSFEKRIFIHHIKIFYPAKLKNKILKIRVYIDNGILGDYNSDSIYIGKYTGFVAFRILTTSNFLLTKFYDDTNEYQIAIDSLNTPVAISRIEFYSDDTSLIKFNINNQASKPHNCKKYTDYTNIKKTLTIDSPFVYCSIEGEKDTISVGKFIKHGLISSKIFVFDNDSFVALRDTFSFSQNEYTLLYNNSVWHKNFPGDYFVRVNTLDTSIIEDIRYATDNNFMDTAVYPCGKCLLRYEVAKKLVKAAKEFREMGYRIKVFDCYRPHSVQYKLWEVVPNKNYVANPDKGSVHNRGGAVDMTLTDMQGNEINMGTDFDFFGFKAFSIDTVDLPDSIITNRRMMWNVMHKYGFYEIKTEWWHLSYRLKYYPLSDVPLPCE